MGIIIIINRRSGITSHTSHGYKTGTRSMQPVRSVSLVPPPPSSFWVYRYIIDSSRRGEMAYCFGVWGLKTSFMHSCSSAAGTHGTTCGRTSYLAFRPHPLEATWPSLPPPAASSCSATSGRPSGWLGTRWRQTRRWRAAESTEKFQRAATQNDARHAGMCHWVEAFSGVQAPCHSPGRVACERLIMILLIS